MENETQERSEEQMSSPSTDEKSWAMGCHLIALMTGFVGPLILWLIKREGNPYVEKQGKEALNFQLSILLYVIICGMLSVVVIGIALMPLVWIANVIFILIASVRANEGDDYRYPLCIRFIK
ncbi:MAG: DUF4870 domain-containing protein [Verrucomicrobia bacterium]|nr:DUF4870 domain-containing protein [Verrucomicrobiota bacterium]